VGPDRNSNQAGTDIRQKQRPGINFTQASIVIRQDQLSNRYKDQKVALTRHGQGSSRNSDLGGRLIKQQNYQERTGIGRNIDQAGAVIEQVQR
jgi:hypothetical protein